MQKRLLELLEKNLMKEMILHSSKKGDLILDPFCGSGSVIELEGKWYEVARGRVENGA